jgi:hypothetical protein
MQVIAAKGRCTASCARGLIAPSSRYCHREDRQGQRGKRGQYYSALYYGVSCDFPWKFHHFRFGPVVHLSTPWIVSVTIRAPGARFVTLHRATSSSSPKSDEGLLQPCPHYCFLSTVLTVSPRLGVGRDCDVSKILCRQSIINPWAQTFAAPNRSH